MNWTVVWKPTSRNELANLWMVAPDRNAVTRAAHAIDTLLRTDPETRGVVNFDMVRTLSVPPLAVDFEVIEIGWFGCYPSGLWTKSLAPPTPCLPSVRRRTFHR